MKIYGAQLTGSIASTGNPVVTGSLTVSGNLTAQQFIVSSSVTFLTTSFSSGSTRFGDTIDDTHQFTGSLSVMGSVATIGVATFLSSVSVNGGSQPLSNGIHTYFSSSISYIDSLQAGVAWRDLSIAGNDLFFKSGGIERMRINSTGNVGIGTTSPLYSTHIVNSGSNAFLGISNQGISNGDRQLRLGFGGNGSHTYASIQGTRYNVADDVNISMQSGGGNVGIGTTTPSTKLEVSDATNAVIKVSATSDGAQAALSLNGYASGGVYRASRLNFQQAGTNKWSILQDYNQDNTNSLTFEQAGTRRVVFDASGNVGIGNNTPSVKLDVSGQIKFSSIATTDYSVSFSGIGAGAWFNIPEVNFNGFNGLTTISIQNDNASYGYTVRASAWIFQTGINGDNIYSGLRSVTIRPDGVSQEGINVVESYHTAPTSGRYNIRMRLRVRDAGLSASNPLNLQIWVDSITSFPASGTLSLKAI